MNRHHAAVEPSSAAAEPVSYQALKSLVFFDLSLSNAPPEPSSPAQEMTKGDLRQKAGCRRKSTDVAGASLEMSQVRKGHHDH